MGGWHLGVGCIPIMDHLFYHQASNVRKESHMGAIHREVSNVL